jgi:hypothetical protein
MSSKVKRFDKERRDVTELPGLWDESDSIEYEITIPCLPVSQIEEAIDLVDAKGGKDEAT